MMTKCFPTKKKNNSFLFGDRNKCTKRKEQQKKSTDVDKFRVLCSPILAVFSFVRVGDGLSTTFNRRGFHLFNGIAIVVFRSLISLLEAIPERADASLTEVDAVSKKNTNQIFFNLMISNNKTKNFHQKS
jgi:hypothetical protein